MLVAKLPRLNNHLFDSQIRLVSCFIRNISGSSNTEQYWDYSPSYGPSYWSKTWSTGQRQSPVDICTKETKYDPSLEAFLLYKIPVQFKATNIGNNVSMTKVNENKLNLKGGPLGDVYRFGEMHMHWGEMNVCGCEHTIDGKRFSGELHLVHWNLKYKEMSQAVDKSDGLAVLGVFLDAQKQHQCHPGLDFILQMFDQVHEEGSVHHSLEWFSPYNMLPAKDDGYFTYLGSLTTPPLFESVTWTVFMQAIKISMKQWERLNCIQTSLNIDGQDRFCKQCVGKQVISNNYRPVQPLHGRTVRTSIDFRK